MSERGIDPSRTPWINDVKRFQFVSIKLIVETDRFQPQQLQADSGGEVWVRFPNQIKQSQIVDKLGVLPTYYERKESHQPQFLI
jgi:hypothetical protein